MTVNLADNYQPLILRTTIAISCLATVAVVLRLISRRIKGNNYALDDLLVVMGLVVSWGCLGLGIFMVNNGVGKHTELASKENLTNFLKALFAYEIVYFVTLAFTKLSILAFYTRIFRTPKFLIVAKIMVGVVIAWLFATIMVAIFSCNPVDAFWTRAPGSKCIVSEHFYIGNAVPNIITDLIILALPVKMIWQLHTSKADRIALTFIFLLGSFVVIASVIRLSQLHQVNNPDILWGFNLTVIWSSIEPSVAVISACLPTLRPLAEFILPSQFRSRSFKEASGNRRGTELISKSAMNPRPDQMDPARRGENGYWVHTNGEPTQLTSVGADRASRGHLMDHENGSSKSQNIRVNTDIKVSTSSIV